MPRRSDSATGLVIVACLSAGLGCEQIETQALEAGHHRLQLVVPAGWEHLDHGRQHLFRSGECQMSLVDMGIATQEGLVHDLQQAETLWRAGRREDAFARLRELRGPMLQEKSKDQVAEFWRPWAEVEDRPHPADSATVQAVFTALIEGTAIFPPVTAEDLTAYVLESRLDTKRYEIASQTPRPVSGAVWTEVETWDRVSHLARSRLAWTENGGYLLVLGVDRGPAEQVDAAFAALLTSIQVVPAAPAPR